jgi:hypothetical protein
MTQDDMRTVLSREPRLTIYGMGIWGKPRAHLATVPEVAATFQAERAALCAAIEMCTRAADWLQQAPRWQRINRQMSSYGLKHVCEKAVGASIANGALICAALHRGFRYDSRHSPDPGPNVWFNIAHRWITAQVAQYGYPV